MHLDKFLSASERVACLPRMTYTPRKIHRWNYSNYGTLQNSWQFPQVHKEYRWIYSSHKLFWPFFQQNKWSILFDGPRRGSKMPFFDSSFSPSFPSTENPPLNAQKRCWPTRRWVRWLRPRTPFERPRSWVHKRKNVEISMEKYGELTGNIIINRDEYTIIGGSLTYKYIGIQGPFTSVISAHIPPKLYIYMYNKSYRFPGHGGLSKMWKSQNAFAQQSQVFKDIFQQWS